MTKDEILADLLDKIPFGAGMGTIPYYQYMPVLDWRYLDVRPVKKDTGIEYLDNAPTSQQK